ncbi:hypothetical protein Dip518_000595 [Parelusimicrobium proximum]|uniref:hypothetical protein n=1 Tax=Parelusimicrobium proximum TaxID=3228953 RepID=UPI003D1771C6
MSKSLNQLLGINFGEKQDCLGLYISPHNMYISQTAKKDNGIEIQGLIRVPIPHGDRTSLKPLELNSGFFNDRDLWLTPLKNAMSKKKWSTNKVVVSLSPSFSLLRHFVTPMIDRKYWKQSIPLQARKYIHFPFEKAAYAYHVYKFDTAVSKQARLGVVFVMTSATIIKALAEGLKAIGLELAAVEIASFSEARMYNNTDKEAVGNKGRLYSFFAANSAQLLFVNEGVPLLFREIDASGPLPIERRKLDVGNCTDFISKQLERDPFEEAVAMGQNLPEWTRVLEAESKKPVRIWDLKEVLGFEPKDVGEVCAIGACSKFMDSSLPDLDLAPNTRTSVQEASALVTLWKVASVCVLGFLAAALFGAFKMFTTATQLQTEQSNVVQVADFQGLTTEQILQKVNDMESKERELSGLLKPDYVTPILVSLVDLLPDDMWITKLDYKKDFSAKSTNAKISFELEGYIYVSSDIKDNAALGTKFKDAMVARKEFAKICPDPNLSYPLTGGNANERGSRFILKCDGGKK